MPRRPCLDLCLGGRRKTVAIGQTDACKTAEERDNHEEWPAAVAGQVYMGNVGYNRRAVRVDYTFAAEATSEVK